MSETRATIRTRVERYVGTAITSTVNDAILERHKELQRAHNWRFMEASATISVSDGDTTFSLPDGFKEEVNPEISDSDAEGYQRMQKVIKNGIESRDTTDSGRTTMYRIWNGSGYLYPEADDDYTFSLEYIKWLSDLDSDTAPTGDDADFLDEVYKAIEFGAIADGFARLKKYQDAAYWEAKFEMKKKELIHTDIAIALAGVDLQMEMYG